MARPLRIEFPGAVYHVTCRGNEQQAIFRDDADRLKFLDILSESASIYSVKLYCAEWVVETFLDKAKADRECPPVNEIRRYCSREKIVASAEKVLGKSIVLIRSEGGLNRQIIMDVLSRVGGLKGREVGEYFGVDYSTVSVSRKQLREKVRKYHQLEELLKRIEMDC